MKNNVNLSDYSTFNGELPKKGQVIVPVVLSEDMRKTLIPLGLKKANVRMWRFPNTSMAVPIVFMAVEEDEEKICRKIFNDDVSSYLKQYDHDENLLSLDAMLEAKLDEDKRGFDPTGTRKLDNDYLYQMLYDKLIKKLEGMDSQLALCVDMLTKGYKNNQILEALQLSVKKTQGYEYIKKAKLLAKQLIEDGDLD